MNNYVYLEMRTLILEIYLDNSSTTKPIEEVLYVLNSSIFKYYGNPSSLHTKGIEAERLIKDAREVIASVLGVSENEIYFTSGATESNNLAILGTAEATIRRGKTIVTTAIEHPSVMDCLNYLEKKGYIIKRLLPENESNEYTAKQFYDAVDEDTVLVTAMMVNNETGLILPVNEIAKAVKQKNMNTYFHTDAVQGFMKIPVKLKNSDIDMLSLSGHKIGAIKGIGVLYKKRRTRILPIIHGGGQQDNLRSGTEPVPAILALSKAVEVNDKNLKVNMNYYKELNQYLADKLCDIKEISINSNDNCANHILSFSVYGIRSEIMLHFLEESDIYVSSGSACSKGKQSYVLEGLGISKEAGDETLRVSFCPSTSKDMLDIFVEKLKEGIKSLVKQR